MSYEMNRFSAQSFERFVQALAVAILGPRTQIFGAGRDGAREATFNGHCRIADADWDGYLVIQAKYHSVAESPAANAEWLIKQIDMEFAKFSDARRALPRPDYYLLASNVRLSASAADREGRGEGGIDRVTLHLRDSATKLGIRDVHLWHADTLSSLLDNHEEIRTSFSFWIQPSDVLAAQLRSISGPRREDVLLRYLRDGVRQSRDIKTRDAGQITGRTLALDEVFIDLPVEQRVVDQRIEQFDLANTLDDETELVFEDEVENFDALGQRPRILANLMVRAADRFDLQNGTPVDSIYDRKSRLANRIVLLGGPGQGKSTIGQFIAQILRARLLQVTTKMQSPEVNTAVTSILERASEAGIPLTGPLRYPIHVDLPRFADKLSEARKLDEVSEPVWLRWALTPRSTS